MDFINCLSESINTIPDLPKRIRAGYLSTTESLVIYPLPGSKTDQVYMDESKDVNLNYEVAMKSKDGEKMERTLWLISDYLEKIKELNSKEASFEFNGLTITSKPFINEMDEQGWLVFLLDFTANITTKEDI